MTWAAALAAIVSILAAVMAFVSARRAAREARNITTLNHKVAALDREADQMRDDYRDLFKEIGGNPGAATMIGLGLILAAGEVLRSHPQANERLRAGIMELSNAWATNVTSKNGTAAPSGCPYRQHPRRLPRVSCRDRANAIRTACIGVPDHWRHTQQRTPPITEAWAWLPNFMRSQAGQNQDHRALVAAGSSRGTGRPRLDRA
jgi:outer membrane murein-binding lipoprotein Lpp